jgi:hypothetical protein
MTGWNQDELTVLADTSSLRLTAGDGPGPEAEASTESDSAQDGD